MGTPTEPKQVGTPLATRQTRTACSGGKLRRLRRNHDDDERHDDEEGGDLQHLGERELNGIKTREAREGHRGNADGAEAGRDAGGDQADETGLQRRVAKGGEHAGGNGDRGA